MVLGRLTSALASGFGVLRGPGWTEAALLQVVGDYYAGMVVVDEHGIIIAASKVARDLLDEGRVLVGQSADGVLPREMLDAVRQVLAGTDPHAQVPLSLAVLRQGDDRDDRLVVQYVATASMLGTEQESGRVASL